MKTRLELQILPQPNFVTCGPTGLHAVYNYYDDPISLKQVIAEVKMLETGGTLAVLLAIHALKRGYKARIHTYNLRIFDPTWFGEKPVSLEKKLRAQLKYKGDDPKFATATRAYLEFLALGGEVLFEDLTPRLIRRYTKASTPILTGLSSTYLYREAREIEDAIHDDVRGEPQGHFVVVSGYDKVKKVVHVADPLHPNPLGPQPYYDVPIERLIGAILLGIITYDGNLLILRPPESKQ